MDEQQQLLYSWMETQIRHLRFTIQAALPSTPQKQCIQQQLDALEQSIIRLIQDH